MRNWVLIWHLQILFGALLYGLWYFSERDPVVLALRLGEDEAYERAVVLLDREIVKHGDRSDAFLVRGIYRLSLINVEGAMRDFDQAIKIGPATSEAYYYRATTYIASENLEAALQDCQQLKAFKVGQILNLSCRSSVSLASGNLEKALLEITQAIESTPLNEDLLLATLYDFRGVLRRGKGDLAEAIVDLSEAIRRNPLLPGAYLQRGIAFRLAGEQTKSQQDFQIYSGLRPYRRPSYLTQIVGMADKGHIPSILEDFRLVFENRYNGLADRLGLQDGLGEIMKTFLNNKYMYNIRQSFTIKTENKNPVGSVLGNKEDNLVP